MALASYDDGQEVLAGRDFGATKNVSDAFVQFEIDREIRFIVIRPMIGPMSRWTEIRTRLRRWLRRF